MGDTDLTAASMEVGGIKAAQHAVIRGPCCLCAVPGPELCGVCVHHVGPSIESHVGQMCGKCSVFLVIRQHAIIIMPLTVTRAHTGMHTQHRSPRVRTPETAVGRMTDPRGGTNRHYCARRGGTKNAVRTPTRPRAGSTRVIDNGSQPIRVGA